MEFNIFSVISLFGGLAMFLYGMKVMGDGLKSSSAEALKRILGRVTANPVSGFLLGLAITAIIQSSAATIVLTVGLISAGILNLKQSITIVMGANVGTTVTAQIIRLMDVQGRADGVSILQFFEPSTLAPMGLILGIVLVMFVKRGNSKVIGTIALGFGILFEGLMMMTSSMSGVTSSEQFGQIVEQLAQYPVLGILIGTLVTTVIQSSSASVGILQTICMGGGVTFGFGYTYVIGAALGTCLVTALISGIGAKADGKRVGVVHVVFNLIGTTIFLLGINVSAALGTNVGLWFSSGPQGNMTSGDVANFETLFKLITALLLLGFVPLLEKLSKRIIKDPPQRGETTEMEQNMQALDAHLLVSPALALSQTEHVIRHMAQLALSNYQGAMNLVADFQPQAAQRLEEQEDLLDRMADTTNQYLIELSPHVEKDSDNNRVNYLIKALIGFERIGDLAVNIMDNAQRVNHSECGFSLGAMQELELAAAAVTQVLRATTDAFEQDSAELARCVEPLEEVIDDLVELLKERHIERQKQGACTMMNGILFQNVLQNLERVSDQCSDIAVYRLAMDDAGIKGREHRYLEEIHMSGDPAYERMYQENREKYLRPIQVLCAEA